MPYNDSQPRQDDGKWISGGSGGGLPPSAYAAGIAKVPTKSDARIAADQRVEDAIISVHDGEGSIELYHGTHRQAPVVHVGQTYADNQDTADHYSDKDTLHGEVDITGLRVAEVSAFDRDNPDWGALGDRDVELLAFQERGIDIISYQDEDPYNRSHDAYRIVSPKAAQ